MGATNQKKGRALSSASGTLAFRPRSTDSPASLNGGALILTPGASGCANGEEPGRLSNDPRSRRLAGSASACAAVLGDSLSSDPATQASRRAALISSWRHRAAKDHQASVVR